MTRISSRKAGWTVAAIVIALLVLPSPAADGSGPRPVPGGGTGSTAAPLEVFILAGQSNMQGHAHVRTFDAIGLDPKTAPILQAMRNADGTPRVCANVWISSIGSADEERVGRLTAGFGASSRGPNIGPEFTFGIYMEKRLNRPILIIKTAWGGKSLHTDFRPPGAGPYEFNETQLETFRKQGYELAGFVWFQGWNDMVDGGTYPDRRQPGGYDRYSRLLAQFIRDVREDLSAPELPFVIGVMGVGGPLDRYLPEQQRNRDVHRNFRAAMAAPADLPEFKGTVLAVPTAPLWDMQVVALRERERALKPRKDGIATAVREGRLSRGEGDAALERIYAEAFTPRELTILRTSTSNADYHYMGSAKIMAQIGKAFAEAMARMMGKAPPVAP